MRFKAFLPWACLGAAWVLVPAGLQAQAPPPPGKERRPNVVFILADDLGYGDLGCFGQKRIKTPHLDTLAAQGLRFTQAYAGSTVCAPSRCALMTGKHTGHSVIRGNRELQPEGQEPLPAGTLTVAHLFKAAGYVTGLVGKWGLGGPGSSGEPHRMGFDHFFGYLCQRKAHEYYPPSLWRDTQRVALDGKTYSHDLMTAEALAFVRRHGDRPFFLYLAYTIPHRKYEVPSTEPYANEPWPPPMKNLAAMITRMDRDVGRLLPLLRELGLGDNTLVLFASDNGAGHAPAFFQSCGPLRGKKRDLYEGGVRTPAIASWPGTIKAGTVSEHVWAFWDFLPTAAELLGARAPGDSDGISFLPTLRGVPGQRQHRFLYWEFHERGFEQAVRMGDWKAVRHGLGHPLELYDLRTDVGERRDVAVRHPAVVRQIEGFLAAARTDSTLWPIRQGKAQGPK
jgi:arylsulfatase A-like enzyme